MNKETKEAFTKEVMDEVLARYAIDKRTIYPLHGNENYVYGYSSKSENYILKLIHSSHRTLGQVVAELDWIRFLNEQEISVALPVASQNGCYVEKIVCGSSYFSAAAYQKVTGNIISQTDLHPLLIKQWGAVMGKMHQAAKKYKNPHPSNKRPAWNEHRVFNDVDLLPSSLQPVKDLFNETVARLQALPKKTDTYGLIHSDLHHQNFILTNNRLFVIDFDDADYNWFINDIAKTLYNEVFNFSIHPKQREIFAAYFFKHFISGYCQENELDYSWVKQIEDFLKLRRAFIFVKWFCDLSGDSVSSSDSAFIKKYRDEASQRRTILNVNYEAILREQS